MAEFNKGDLVRVTTEWNDFFGKSGIVLNGPIGTGAGGNYNVDFNGDIEVMLGKNLALETKSDKANHSFKVGDKVKIVGSSQFKNFDKYFGKVGIISTIKEGTVPLIRVVEEGSGDCYGWYDPKDLILISLGNTYFPDELVYSDFFKSQPGGAIFKDREDEWFTYGRFPEELTSLYGCRFVGTSKKQQKKGGGIVGKLSALAKKFFDADTKALVKAGILDDGLNVVDENDLINDFIVEKFKKDLAIEARKWLQEEKKIKAA